MWLSCCRWPDYYRLRELSKRFSTFGTKSRVRRALSDSLRQSSKNCWKATESGRPIIGPCAFADSVRGFQHAVEQSRAPTEAAGRRTRRDRDGSLGKPNRPGAGIGTRTEFRSEGRARSALGRTSRQPWVRNSLGRSPPQAARREVTRKPVFRPQADQEVQSARQWYEEQRPGLGIEFAGAIDEVVERISSNPLAFPIVHSET